MQAELKEMRPGFNIELLGINKTNQGAYNAEMTENKALPWLQPPPGTPVASSVWTTWHATWRDVKILDPLNQFYTVYNLTQHDLSNPDNYAELKQILFKEATIVDSDADQLPDAWEQKYFGNLDSKATDDPDGDGFDNKTEFAWGTDPTNPASTPRMHCSVTRDGRFMVVFYRWSGGVFKYLVDASKDFEAWDSSALAVRNTVPTNLYDGTGRFQMIVYAGPLVKDRVFNFLRVRATR
jgi:hypothetical protein